MVNNNKALCTLCGRLDAQHKAKIGFANLHGDVYSFSLVLFSVFNRLFWHISCPRLVLLMLGRRLVPLETSTFRIPWWREALGNARPGEYLKLTVIHALGYTDYLVG